MAFDGAPSKQEKIKQNSKFLKGNIAAELADTSSGAVSNETYELLKFHGSYFGHNRDTATERKKQKLEKEYEFMVRTRIPGGRLTAEQYLAMDEIGTKYANDSLKITTRQVFQFHVVVKENMKNALREINEALLSTQSGCGDVVRNITASPAPYKDAKHKRLFEDVERVAEFVRPKTSSYKELWLDEEADEVRERSVEKPEEYEPLYGTTYMPRKFKIGLILPEDNSIDVFTHDLGIVLIFEDEELKGYNILVGGGMGMKHEAAKNWDDKKTYPRIADPLAFVGPNDLIPAVEAVVKLQRDFGDRNDRQHARLKYVVAEKGLEWTRKTFEEYFAKAGGGETKDPVKIKYEIPSHMGWHEQGDGKLFLGLPIPSGRIVDYDKKSPSKYEEDVNEQFAKARYKTGIDALVKKYKPEIVLTPTCEMIFYDINPADKPGMEEILKANGIPLVDEYTPMQQNFFTCVSLPTCQKALAEAERVQFKIFDAIQAVMNKHGIGQDKMTVRVTGCPNGCARPYVGDIGIVGRAPGLYVLFIGGDFEGTRLNRKVFDKVPLEDIAKALDPMFGLFAQKRADANEGFGNFCNRYGIEKLVEEVKPALAEYKWA